MAFVRAASFAELAEAEPLGVEVEGLPVALVLVEGEVYAFADKCSHRDYPLSHGEFDADECTITCEWHGAQFDVRTGAVLCLPATRPIPVYDCKVEDGEVWVDVER
ncbi:MAG TPA: non-heme iron oxygenase ferredoxin subunit [Longimicrobiaceae bacterium]|jgi:3-phenylpropionate/trans-cinnamate dioxygenase ferredoxin subunit|nr:non-heme iron oxygenase ferredoxin subunit [Longimicrobiaceae bacterium]